MTKFFRKPKNKIEERSQCSPFKIFPRHEQKKNKQNVCHPQNVGKDIANVQFLELFIK